MIYTDLNNLERYLLRKSPYGYLHISHVLRKLFFPLVMFHIQSS